VQLIQIRDACRDVAQFVGQRSSFEPGDQPTRLVPMKVSADAVGGPRLDAVMIVEPVVPMRGSERGPRYHLLHLYWF
jgi:hypothetical protein